MLEWFSKRGEKNRERRREALSAYMDGELSAREQTRIEQELAQDAALRAELAEMRRTVQMVRSLPTLPVPRSFTLDPATYGRTRPRRVHLYPLMRAATVVAMVLFVFLTAGNFLFQGATAPGEEIAMGVEVTREVEKEVVVETVEVAAEEALEAAAEPAEGEVATEAPMLEAPAAAVAETVVEVEEEVVVEAEPVDAAQEEMPAAATPSPDATPSAPPAAPSEEGVGAGAPSPSVEVPPTPEPTPEPTAASVARAAEDSVEAPSPEAFTAVEQPPETSVPEAAPIEPVEKAQEDETDQLKSGQVDWWLVVWWGAGLLGAGLLVVTLLARRFGW